jgi:predicted metal-dependent hydrolase
MAIHTLQYGTTAIEYALSYASRKTLGITVHPDDLHVTVRAPDGTPLEDIERVIHKRAAWILAQQRDLARYLPHLPPRQYVSGETHRYLGKPYRLKVIESRRDIVKPTRGWMRVYVLEKDPARVKRLLDAWYRARAEHIFAERLAACYPKVEHMGVPYPDLIIRVLKTRWGNCKEGTITLNVKLIQVPTAYIDYVIFHELCHLAEPNHTPRFYELLSRVLPDWETRREKLNLFEFA